MKAKSLDLSLLVTLLVSFITVVPTFMPQAKAKPLYLVSEPVKIVHTGTTPSKISIRNNNTVVTEKDIYLAKVHLWNGGKQAIPTADVLDPVKIYVTGCDKILDYKILDMSYPSVAGFKLTKNLTNKTTSKIQSLTVSWRRFDPGFYLTIELIFAGDEASEISVDGYISGVKITRHTYNPISGERYFNPSDELTERVSLRSCFGFAYSHMPVK